METTTMGYIGVILGHMKLCKILSFYSRSSLLLIEHSLYFFAILQPNQEQQAMTF